MDDLSQLIGKLSLSLADTQSVQVSPRNNAGATVHAHDATAAATEIPISAAATAAALFAATATATTIPASAVIPTTAIPSTGAMFVLWRGRPFQVNMSEP